MQRIRQLSSGTAVLLAHCFGCQRRPKSSLQSKSALAFGTEKSDGGDGSSTPAWICVTKCAWADVHTAARCASA